MAAPHPAPMIPQIRATELCKLAAATAKLWRISETDYLKALGAISNLYCLLHLDNEFTHPIRTTSTFASDVVSVATIQQEIVHSIGPKANGKQRQILHALSAAFDELFHKQQHPAIYVTGFGIFRHAGPAAYDLQIFLPMQQIDGPALASA